MEKTIEKRNKPRVNCNYPVAVEGVNGNGNKFHEEAKLANLSATGLYMIVNRHLECGNTVSMTIQLADATEDDEAPKISANGIVVRSESRVDGTCGVAVKFKNYRFL
jgi:c-di-GMP-binding flagellar brake protein YcgR